jgi:hypothetical protein
MLKRILFSLLLFGLFSLNVFAQGHGLGLGLVLGEPTGISCKGWVTNSGAVQLGIGYPSLSHSQGTAISVDYVWHSHVFRSHEYFPLFYGIGGIFGASRGTNIMGARGILGIAWWPHRSDLDVFLQLEPTLYLNPTSQFEFDFGFGVRYFF